MSKHRGRIGKAFARTGERLYRFGSSMKFATLELDAPMRVGEQAMSEEKIRIVRHRLIEQASGFHKFLEIASH